MNTLGDILKLQNQATENLVRSGCSVTEVAGYFNDRMGRLIRSAFINFCPGPEGGGEWGVGNTPSLDEMCRGLGKINQGTPLPVTVQAWYYCTAAVLLTMDGHDDDTVFCVQWPRAQALVNAGILK